ncbi:protein FAR1-RELATED SEQUENCE 1-like [Aegilops tauschii subsp. strangulata]|uniref:protein FAR1-RELATED SEQUENCE 1-like n=1 Tax=Aegilops tauschii subsp. strangulata TaxID=200361 RepID=UPI003CC8C6D0
MRKVPSSTAASWIKSAMTFRANPPSPFTLRHVQTAHELLKGKWTAQANAKVVQTDEKRTSSCKRKKSLQHEDKNMPLNLIPAARMKFTTYDKAWDFYNNYARCAGFGIRQRAQHKTNTYIVCSREGTHKQTVLDYPRKRQKTSKRIDCKAKIRVKKRKDGKFVIEMVELNHNHKMLESPGMLLHKRSHKKDDPLIDQLVKDMQLDNHTHAQMMSTLSRMSGGLQYMGHTSRDWVNKKQKFAREESQYDVKKLLDFFEKMQKINPEFFYDYDVDADNRRYNLQDDKVMNSLWEDRHEWISAYYKEVFCARMTSTQRSESMNRILKQNFVKEKHDLHLFAQQVDKCIQTRKVVEHAQTVANEVNKKGPSKTAKNITTETNNFFISLVHNSAFLIMELEVKTTTQFGFEVQLSKVYTRAVFADFKETLYRSTPFRAERCPENPTKYLVHHYNRSNAFDWARHNFQVVADEQKGVYECECKL